MCFFSKKKKQKEAEQKEVKAVETKAAAPVKEEVAEEAPAKKEKATVTEQPAKEETVAKAAPKKQSAQPADAAKKAKFVYRKTDKGNYVYKLYSSNYRVIAIGGEPYSSLSAMKTGINSIIKNAADAPVEDQTLKKVVEQKCPKWEIYLDAKGEYRFRLKASNGNIVCITNDGYLSKPACKNGMQAIAKAAANAEIVQSDED